MAYDFKKINELELVNGVPEGANVLIETEGTTKRLPSTAINNGYAKDEVYNKNEADEKFLTKETIAKPDWNQNDENAADYVKNRTHWSEEVYRYIWDGNTEEKTIITPEGAPFSYVKVTNDILTSEDLIGATMIVNGVAENELPLAPEAILDETCVFDNGDGLVYVSWETPVVMAFDKAMSVGSIECPSAGVYVMYVPSTDPTTTPIYCSELSKTVVHKLDKKYLPDDIGGIKYVTIGMDDNDNYIASATYDEISEWIKAAFEVKCVCGADVLCHVNSTVMPEISTFELVNQHRFSCVKDESVREIRIEEGDEVFYYEYNLALESDIPTALPNPNALTINGVSYDGSAAVDVPAVQPNLLQNDPNAPDYVKNRTHWEDDDGTVHKLDKKFLPDDVGGNSGGGAEKVLVRWLGNDNGYVSDKTYDQIIEELGGEYATEKLDLYIGSNIYPNIRMVPFKVIVNSSNILVQAFSVMQSGSTGAKQLILHELKLTPTSGTKVSCSEIAEFTADT